MGSGSLYFNKLSRQQPGGGGDRYLRSTYLFYPLILPAQVTLTRRTRAGTWVAHFAPEGFTHDVTSISHRPLLTKHVTQPSSRRPGLHASSLSYLILSGIFWNLPSFHFPTWYLSIPLAFSLLLVLLRPNALADNSGPATVCWHLSPQYLLYLPISRISPLSMSCWGTPGHSVCPGHTSPSPTMIFYTCCILEYSGILEQPLFSSQFHPSCQTKFKGHFHKIFPYYWVNHSFCFSLFFAHVLLEYLRLIALDFVRLAWPVFVSDEEVSSPKTGFFLYSMCPSP